MDMQFWSAVSMKCSYVWISAWGSKDDLEAWRKVLLSVAIDVARKKRIAQRGKNEKRTGGGVMPKLKPSDLQIRRAVVRAELRKNMELEMLSGKQAAKKINMAESTYCGRLRETETIRLEELWRMTKVLHLTDDQLLRIAKGG